ncbi:RNA ligase family protein [Oxalobacter vibrioformis]|uniref:RNA ligase family protein n=1 Tax=Oxalobacter vibrioformis TaxID=933080 RepID=A0A9E9LY16_9BURK|nr:RNA ligase family protein [Oxalobacter vibrioformis]WAW11361.1 RNA ligase family protein [Oxalobacter vibrioformis]
MESFVPFPKLHRLSREIIITEKIDGTNAQVHITEDGDIFAGSRNRYLTPENDNYGFASWVLGNKEELLKLGPGRHFGEWYGRGIQRGYGLCDRYFALFNVGRWTSLKELPECCLIVPILYQGVFSKEAIDNALRFLERNGSYLAPGFMNPEGIVIYHKAAGVGFKKLLENDHLSKTEAGLKEPSEPTK